MINLKIFIPFYAPKKLISRRNMQPYTLNLTILNKMLNLENINSFL
jgi:hypothetical protein